MLTQLWQAPTLVDLADSIAQLPEEGVFLVATDYKDTVTVMKNGFSGTAKLGKKDEFNLITGIKAALLRWSVDHALSDCDDREFFEDMNQSHLLMAAVSPSDLDRIALEVARNAIASKEMSGHYYMGELIDTLMEDLQVSLIGTSI